MKTVRDNMNWMRADSLGKENDMRIQLMQNFIRTGYAYSPTLFLRLLFGVFLTIALIPETAKAQPFKIKSADNIANVLEGDDQRDLVEVDNNDDNFVNNRSANLPIQTFDDLKTTIENRRQACINAALYRRPKNPDGRDPYYDDGSDMPAWQCPEDSTKYYYPEITQKGLVQSLTIEMGAGKNVSCAFAIVQMMYDYAKTFRAKDLSSNNLPLNDPKNKAYANCMYYTNAAFKQLLSYYAPSMDNTTYTLNLLAAYIKYKDIINEFDDYTLANLPTEKTKVKLNDWISAHFYSSGTGGTSNLITIANSKNYLLALTELGRPPRTGIPRGMGGEYASDPYGAQNMVPFLILGNFPQYSSYINQFIDLLDLYSYTWLDGHLVSFSTRTYPVADGQGTSHGLKSVLGFFFDRFSLSQETFSISFPKGVAHPVLLDLENHAFEMAVYSLDLNRIQRALERGHASAVDPVVSPRGIMGKMHTDSCYWSYFLSDNYGVYTQSPSSSYVVPGKDNYFPEQTRPSGVMWRNRQSRSNFFMAIPNDWPAALKDRTDHFQQKGVQQWSQYGPTYLMVTSDLLSPNSLKEEYHKVIFGSMPDDTTLSANGRSFHSIVLDATYATQKCSPRFGNACYRLFYSISAENPVDPEQGSVFIALSSPLPFVVGNRQVGYPISSLSFIINLDFPDRSMGVAVETARPVDFEGTTLAERFGKFKSKINDSTNFTFLPSSKLPGGKVNSWTSVYYTDLNGNRLRKMFHSDDTAWDSRTNRTIDFRRIPWPNREEVAF